MSRPLYYLTFRRATSLVGEPKAYGPLVTVFTDRAPKAAYDELKRAGFYVAYGREGDKPTRDSAGLVGWDTDAGEGYPSGARS